MSDYAYMEDAVQAICDSLVSEPHKWVVNTYTFKKGWSGPSYWTSIGDNAPITEIWNGFDSHQVFSIEQGKRIREAYNIMRRTQASEHQKKVINSMLSRKETAKKKGFFARLFGC